MAAIFDGKICRLQEDGGFFHAKFQDGLRKVFARLFRQQARDVDRVVAKVSGRAFERRRIGMELDIAVTWSAMVCFPE